MLIVNSAVMVAIWEAQGLTLQCCFLYGCDLRISQICVSLLSYEYNQSMSGVVKCPILGILDITL